MYFAPSHVSSALAAVLVISTTLRAAAPLEPPRAGGKTASFELDNGLNVMLRPVQGATNTALVTLFDVGELHDPQGQSGFGHLMEHLYVTAASGDAPARTVDTWFARYQMQANAQTGADYTLIATVFPNDQLEAELIEAASRMTELRLVQADLEREIPRVDAELKNMYERMPALAAMNHARLAADPPPAGARKGGVQEQIATITLDELSDRHRRFYKPVNATIVIAGGFDAEKTAVLIKHHFGAIEGGNRPPAPQPTQPPRVGVLAIDAVKIGDAGVGGAVKAPAVLAYRAPSPDSEWFAAFLTIAARLQQRSMPLMQQSKGKFMPFTYAPLDDPRVVFLAAEVREEQQVGEVVEQFRKRIDAASRLGPGETLSSLPVLTTFGPMLGLVDLPEAMIAQNSYLTALSLGRLKQMGIDPAALKRKLDALTPADLEAAAAEVLGPEVLLRPWRGE